MDKFSKALLITMKIFCLLAVVYAWYTHFHLCSTPHMSLDMWALGFRIWGQYTLFVAASLWAGEHIFHGLCPWID